METRTHYTPPMNTLLTRYLGRTNTFRPKWVEYLKREDLKLRKDLRSEKLTPFYGLPIYNDMTNKEKEDAFVANIQFFAELQIFLEVLVVYGYYKCRKYETAVSDEIAAGMRLLALEELYHTKAYKHFLNQQNFEGEILLGSHLLRKLAAKFISMNPLVITLVAAKFESFSGPYLKELKDIGTKSSDPWVELNTIHLEDELFHVPLQFDFYNASVKEFGFFKTVLPLAGLYLVFQMVLIVAMKNILKKTFPTRSILEKMRLYPHLIYWSSRRWESFQKSRKILKNYFLLKRPAYRRVLKFLYS